MTINSLVNFGVPGIAGERAAPMQPIMANKFRVIFNNFAGQEHPYVLTQQVRKATLPSLNFKISFDNNEYKAKEASWAEAYIRFLDEVSGALFSAIMKQAKIQETDHTSFTMDIDLMDSQKVIRRYSHKGCEVSGIRAITDLNYASTDGLEFTLKVRYKDVVALMPVTKFEGFMPL